MTTPTPSFTSLAQLPEEASIPLGFDPTGLLRELSVDANGNLNVNVISGSSESPGSGTSGGAVTQGAGSSANPWYIEGLGTAGSPSGGVLTVQGPAGGLSVSGTFWQATQPVSGTFWQAIQPVSGTVALAAGSAAIGNVSVSNLPGINGDGGSLAHVTNFPATQIVSGGAAAGSAPTNPPVSVSGLDGNGNKQHLLTDTTGRVQVTDTATAALQAAQAGAGLKTLQANAAPGIGAATIATAATAQQLPSVAAPFGVTLQNQSASDTIYIGTSNAVSGASNGYKLAPGQVLSVSGLNLALYWFVGPSTGSVIGYSV